MANLRTRILNTVSDMNTEQLKALNVTMQAIIDNDTSSEFEDDEEDTAQEIHVTTKKGKNMSNIKNTKNAKSAKTSNNEIKRKPGRPRLSEKEKAARKLARDNDNAENPARKVAVAKNDTTENFAEMSKRELREAVAKLQIKTSDINGDIARFLKKVYAKAETSKLSALQKEGDSKGVNFFFGRGRQTEIGKKRKMAAQIMVG